MGSRRHLLVISIVLGLGARSLVAGLPNPPDCDPLVGRGSLLFYANVELKWDAGGTLTQDTVLTLRNHHVFDVNVQFYFVNGDTPTDAFVDDAGSTERAHPGWNHVDCQVRVRRRQTVQYAAGTGLPLGCQPFGVLDPGLPPGRPDPDGPIGSRVLRGYAVVWAVNARGREISWNHLTGQASVVDVGAGRSWPYDAYSFRAISASHGQETDCTPGQLLLDGVEYGAPYSSLIFDFAAAGATEIPPDALQVVADTDLTLLPTHIDFRQDGAGPITTKARFSVWNAHGTRLSGTQRCITCWDQTPLSNYDAPNNLLRTNLQTDRGTVQIDGIASNVCPRSQSSGLLGIMHETLTSAPDGDFGDLKWTGKRLRGMGRGFGVIKYDIVQHLDERRNVTSDSRIENQTPVKARASALRNNQDPASMIVPTGACVSPAAGVSIQSAIPAGGLIDARQPIDTQTGEPTGWDTVYLRFDGDTCDLIAQDFEISVEPPMGTPTIARIIPHCDNVTLILNTPIPAGARTIITHVASGTSICLRHLPGDANGDGTSGPLDILHLVDHLNGVYSPPMALPQCDIDRSCQCGPSDIIALVDLLNGAGAFDPWLFVQVPQCPEP